jgi:hypothetical protein
MKKRLLLFCCIAANTYAYTTGISGYSGKDGKVCSECHAAGAAKPSAAIQGPTALAAGASAEYQLVIDTDVNSAASAKRIAGIDIAAGAGTLATVNQVNQTRLIDGEISHTNALPEAKTVALSFQLTAPAQLGPLTLFGAALSADGNGGTGGDSVATTSFQVEVTATPPDLADAISGASTRDQPASADLGPPRDEPRWSCGSYAGAMSVPVAVAPLLAILCLALLLRRRV